MVFTSSSKRRGRWQAARSAAEAGAAAVLLAAAGRLVAGAWEGVLVGTAAAWFGSTVGAVWLLKAGEISSRAFWWAFGGGFFLRLVLLAALVVAAALRPDSDPAPMLVSYAVGVILMLTIEYRHFRLR